jgi:ribosome-associated protein
MADLYITPELSIPLGEITIRTSRSSGPGGQHANVSASRVQASFDVGSSRSLSERQRELILARAGGLIAVVCQDERSQARNRDLALERLAGRLRFALAEPQTREPTSPTYASRKRRLQTKRRIAVRKAERRPPSTQED